MTSAEKPEAIPRADLGADPDTSNWLPRNCRRRPGREPEGDGMASRVGGRTQNWAPIALSDGKLLIRDQQQLKCVKVGQ